MSNKKTIRIIILAAIVIVVIFHAINVMYLFPSFERVTINNAEKDSIMIARHLSDMFEGDAYVENGKWAISDYEAIFKDAMDDFGLENIKMFSAAGVILYSSNPVEIGRSNTLSYFHEVVSKGSVVKRFIEKNKTTFEGQQVTTDLVEVYVPVMKDGEFVGAFEIYMDITEKAEATKDISEKYLIALLIGMIAFLSLVFISILKHDAGLDKTILSGQVRGKYFTVLIIGLSLFITETIIMYILPSLFKPEDKFVIAIIDSLLLLTVTSPVLYYFLFVPMYQQISATKKAENAQRESEQRFRLTFDDAPIGAAIVGIDGSIQKTNKKLSDYLGYTEEEFKSRSFIDLMAPEERLECATKLSAMTSDENTECNSDNKFSCKDGSSFWGHISMRLITDSSGVPLYFLPMIENINQRKLMEQELLGAKHLWEDTFNSMPDSICILDDEINIVQANAASRALAGVNDIEGLNICDMLCEHTSSDVKCPDMLCNDSGSDVECPCQKVLDTSKTTIYEYYNSKFDKYIEVRIIPRHDQQWRLEGFVHITRDITERRRAEEEVEKLSRAVSQSPVSVVITDLEGNIEYVNPKFTELTGYSYEEVQGKSPSILRSDKIPDEYYSEMWETLMAGEVWTGEFCNMKKNGEIFWENAVISPIKNKDGKVTHFVGVKEDITERKEARDALLEAKLSAELANQAKSEFLARMSHEIRTPMNAIIGMSSLVKMTELTSQQDEYISHISSASHALLKIINDILDFSKIEAGKYELESVEFKLEDVLKNIRNIIGISARDKALEMIFSISDKIPETLLGDPLRLEQILINLGANAVKFTEKGEVVLNVELVSIGEENITLIFSIIDSGIGMTEEQMKGLFQAFAQADGSTTRKYGGTGLGLSISKRLVEMMGGEISVSSAPNEGSRFSFTAELEYKNGSPDNLDDLQGLKVMVLEGNWFAREMFCSTLSDMGIHVVTVSTIDEAEREYMNAADRKERYDILFVDSSIAGTKGAEAFRNLKKMTMPFETKIILMMKHGDERGMDSGYREIYEACISKPAMNTELVGAIRDVLGFHNKNEDNLPGFLTGNKALFEDLRGKRVLLAEDNMINQLLATKLLEGAGITVDTVKNGKDAVDAVDMEDYDLVLMDIEMPLMDGLDATARIRGNSRHKSIPIIAMTAHAMDEHRQRSLDAGMNGHITKPIDVGNFFDTIQKCIVSGNESSQDTHHAGLQDAKGHSRGLPSDIPGLNIQLGIDNCDGEHEFYKELLVEFREHYGNVPDIIETHIRKGKTKQAAIEAHSLKGTAGTLGALDLQRASEELEEALAKGAGDVPEGLIVGLGDALSLVMDGLGSIPMRPGRSKGDDGAMYEALKDLENSLKTSRPRNCASALQRIKALDSSEDLQPALHELEMLVSQYKYHSAGVRLNTLMKQFSEAL